MSGLVEGIIIGILASSIFWAIFAWKMNNDWYETCQRMNLDWRDECDRLIEHWRGYCDDMNDSWANRCNWVAQFPEESEERTKVYYMADEIMDEIDGIITDTCRKGEFCTTYKFDNWENFFDDEVLIATVIRYLRDIGYEVRQMGHLIEIHW